jgi:hypothetical protein
MLGEKENLTYKYHCKKGKNRTIKKEYNRVLSSNDSLWDENKQLLVQLEESKQPFQNQNVYPDWIEEFIYVSNDYLLTKDELLNFLIIQRKLVDQKLLALFHLFAKLTSLKFLHQVPLCIQVDQIMSFLMTEVHGSVRIFPFHILHLIFTT